MKEFTPTEAAAIIDLPVRFVQKAIDEGPLGAARNRKGRALDLEDLVFLYLIGRLDSGFVRLTSAAKRQLRKKLGESLRASTALDIGGCVFQVKSAFRTIRTRLAKLQTAKRKVVQIQKSAAACQSSKAPGSASTKSPRCLNRSQMRPIFFEEYPSLQAQDLEIAKIYSAAYPRRGRPPRHPWHIAQRPREVAA